jgi:hypothetical protein
MSAVAGTTLELDGEYFFMPRLRAALAGRPPNLVGITCLDGRQVHQLTGDDGI